MTTESIKTIQYDDSNFKALMGEFKRLMTFAEVGDWDKRAQAEVDQITDVIQQLDNEITEQTQVLDKVKQARSEKSFFARMLSNRDSETDLATHIEQCRKFKIALEDSAIRMQEAIDFTPNSADEQKVLIKELKQRKKELQLEKRNIAAEMKAIRNEARQQSANAGRGFLGMYNSKLAASQRRNIRYTREAALGPHEDARAAIERQLIQIDRDILWAERFREEMD